MGTSLFSIHFSFSTSSCASRAFHPSYCILHHEFSFDLIPLLPFLTRLFQARQLPHKVRYPTAGEERPAGNNKIIFPPIDMYVECHPHNARLHLRLHLLRELSTLDSETYSTPTPAWLALPLALSARERNIHTDIVSRYSRMGRTSRPLITRRQHTTYQVPCIIRFSSTIMTSLLPTHPAAVVAHALFSAVGNYLTLFFVFVFTCSYSYNTPPSRHGTASQLDQCKQGKQAEQACIPLPCPPPICQ
ncbi:hypothetical protein BU26DRAFT_240981 [Trematosphaeria pertusa]|uniref:Uncharacterized protein n=1 Tax=Trematosphaeria pertusa TaxID=390896 RepID=A0A6A6IPB4_9PLEO|nr:uncharacterized protein BU26DRAFT_240981 [Trematosphaeria pertusa]KAF2251642.1 hypothetical protein BU26DRAFT_240981 [Trematosphaeria pertusa]